MAIIETMNATSSRITWEAVNTMTMRRNSPSSVPNKRRRGALLAISSLPSKYGIGTFGESAYRFIDALSFAGGSIWAILPLGHTGYGDSPYQSLSAYALNPYFLDLELLIDDGLLTKQECESVAFGDNDIRVDYAKLYKNRLPLIMTAYARSLQSSNYESEIDGFYNEQAWLHDYCLFMAIKQEQGGSAWYEWDGELRQRDSATLEKLCKRLRSEIGFYAFLQYKLYSQWQKLREYASSKGVLIMGDMPIYCAYDSADCWADTRQFMLDDEQKPIAVAGVPPDYFSPDGQRWGNPLYDWEHMRKNGYAFWLDRIRYASKLYDILRIDHFRGFESFYAIPANSSTAKQGQWMKACGYSLFRRVKQEGLPIEIVAEDLGFITPSVKRLVAKTGFAGMQILQFAFDGSRKNPHIPIKWDGDAATLRNLVAYTGTHDNPTLAGWWAGLDEKARQQIANKMGGDAADMPSALIEAVVSSDAVYALIPMQDILLLGNEARMNTPSSESGNWAWRMTTEQMQDSIGIMKYYFEQ